VIPFNRQTLYGPELDCIREAYERGRTCGDGEFGRRCEAFIERRLGCRKALLTPSGTAALEMAAVLAGVGPGDEVVVPSYTFVSTANAFVLRGARPVFCDVRPDTLCMDESLVDALVGPRTRAVVPVHYAGVACGMDSILDVAARRGLVVIEDAAQAFDARWRGRALGTIGAIGCLSFHETKNVSMGEGGAILLNDESLVERAEIVREKGTDRSRFFRGQVDKYRWVDVGSSWLPSEISAAVLWVQLERADAIRERRLALVAAYREAFADLEADGTVRLPVTPFQADPNGHMMYLLLRTEAERDRLIAHLGSRGITAVFHYVPLHESAFCRERWGAMSLPVTESVSRRLVRLPLFHGLTDPEQREVAGAVRGFFGRS